MEQNQVIDDSELRILKLRKLYHGKERLVTEQDQVTNMQDRLAIITWQNDLFQEPHFHVIDNKTHGNEINAAYSMITGKLIPGHGSVITKLTDRQLKHAVSMIKEPIENERRSRWYLMKSNWNASNAAKIDIKAKMPTFTNCY